MTLYEKTRLVPPGKVTKALLGDTDEYVGLVHSSQMRGGSLKKHDSIVMSGPAIERIHQFMDLYGLDLIDLWLYREGDELMILHRINEEWYSLI